MIEIRDAIARGVDALGLQAAPVIWDLANADWKNPDDYQQFLNAVSSSDSGGQQ